MGGVTVTYLHADGQLEAGDAHYRREDGRPLHIQRVAAARVVMRVEGITTMQVVVLLLHQVVLRGVARGAAREILPAEDSHLHDHKRLNDRGAHPVPKDAIVEEEVSRAGDVEKRMRLGVLSGHVALEDADEQDWQALRGGMGGR